MIRAEKRERGCSIPSHILLCTPSRHLEYATRKDQEGARPVLSGLPVARLLVVPAHKYGVRSPSCLTLFGAGPSRSVQPGSVQCFHSISRNPGDGDTAVGDLSDCFTTRVGASTQSSLESCRAMESLRRSEMPVGCSWPGSSVGWGE